MTATHDEVVATGRRVRLRHKQLADTRHDYAWRRDSNLARYDAARPTTLTYHEFLAQATDELENPHPYRRTFAVEDFHGEHIGNVMYYNLDAARREVELGITIGNAAFWGHGYGSEAVTLLLRHLFGETVVERIYLHTLDWNLRAQKSFTRAGFRICGKSRRGEYRFVVMDIWRDQMQAMHAAGGDSPTGTSGA